MISHFVPDWDGWVRLRLGWLLVAFSKNKAGAGVATFLSTFLMKVDKKGRVSVPATFRAALNQTHAHPSFSGIVAFASPVVSAIDAHGRAEFDALLSQLRSHAVANVGPDLALLGGAETGADQILAAAAAELPFDGEGRIVLPEQFLAHAGIGEQVSFVGRGSFFQIWSPENFAEQQAGDLEKVRARLLAGRPPGDRGKQ